MYEVTILAVCDVCEFKLDYGSNKKCDGRLPSPLPLPIGWKVVSGVGLVCELHCVEIKPNPIIVVSPIGGYAVHGKGGVDDGP